MGRGATYVRVPYQFLDECFSYSEDGSLHWKLRPAGHFKTPSVWKAWHTRCFGKTVGTLDRQGYFNIGIHYKGVIQRLHVHRILLCLHLRRDPLRTEIVDHIDRDRSNNALSNLRLVDHSVNGKNTLPRKNNTSGQKYIFWCKQKTKWQVSAVVSNKRVHVGFYLQLQEAIEAQKAFYEEGL